MSRGSTRSNNMATGITLPNTVDELKELKEQPIIETEQPIMASETEFKHIWIISNKKLTPNVKKHLSSYDNIVNHDSELFTNRDCKELMESHNCNHIWTDISNPKTLKWVAKNIMKKHLFKIVLAYSSIACQKASKWLDDLRDTEQLDLEIKYKDLAKLKSLTVGGLMSQLETFTSLHSPPTLLQTLTRDSRVIKKKR